MESRNFVTAFGIAVSDLTRSVDFYTRVLGMTELERYDLDDMEEVVVGFPGSPGIVLMAYKGDSPPKCTGLPIKIVLSFADPFAIGRAISDEGLTIHREVAPAPEFGNAILGFASDPDGYIIEILSADRLA